MKITSQIFLKKSLIAALTFAALSPLAYADYNCTGRERKLTDAEKDMYTRAAAAMRAALLPPPAGWTMNPPSTRTPSETLCADFKNDPITFGASAVYTRRPTLEDRRTAEQTSAEIKKELDALRALPADLQSKVDALNADASAIRKEAREAERAGNRDLAKSKYAANEEIAKQIRKMRDAHATAIRPQEEQIVKKYDPVYKLKRDFSYTISLVGNDTIRANDGNVERIQFGSNAKTNQSTDRVVRITAVFERDPNGTPEQAQIVKGLIDKDKLQALVSGALPSLAESQAVFAKQDEAIAALRAQDNELSKTASAERNAETSSQKQNATPKTAQTNSPATSSASTTVPSSSTSPPNEVASATPATATAAKPANDAANQTKEVANAVNKLRGLFGK
jgi:hypothetical protein